jgi:ribonucleotide reductase beta subunit family protein with ferritin-like domain
MAVGGEKVFDIDFDKLESVKWFEEELLADVSVDFFHKKSTAYSKNMQAITADDIF